MTEPNPIREPGVDVLQSVRTTTPVVSSPMLMPVVVGPCKKVLEATLPGGDLNEDARLRLPAVYQPFLTLVGVVPTAITVVGGGGQTMTVEVSHGPARTITFAAGDWTLNRMVDHVNTQAATLGMAVVAEKIMVSSTQGFFRLRTTALGDSAAIRVTWSATCSLATDQGLPPSWFATGADQYASRRLILSQNLIPDPWGLYPDLDLLEDTVRAFLSTDTTILREMYKTETVSRAGLSWLIMEDDLDGDGSTPLLKFITDAVGTPAYPNDAELPTPARDANVPNFGVTPTQATFTGIAYGVGTFVLGIDGWQEQTITIPGGTPVADARDLINRYFPGRASLDGTATFLKLDSALYGRESVIRISGPNAHTIFGGAGADYPKILRGAAQQVAVGDEVWVEGVKMGTVVEVVSTGANSVVRLDKEYLLNHFTLVTGESKNWHIIAKDLPASLSATGAGSAPTPDVYVTQYLIQIRHDALRIKGKPLFPPMNAVWGKAHIPLFFEALRLDVTARATTRDKSPVIIQGNDYASLSSQFEPLDAQNPLGLAAAKCLAVSGDSPIAVFGVDEVSTAYPEGTPNAYVRAFSRLEAYDDAYTITPLSQELEVHTALATHIALMSKAKARRERIGFITAPFPTRDEPTLVGSGTKGNAGAAGPAFETGLLDLADLFIGAGVTKSTFTETDGVYLNIEGDTKNYLVTGYAGTTLTCAAGVVDSFFAAALWAAVVIDKTFSISVRGALLVDTNGDPDNLAIARAIGRRALWFKTRRVVLGAPNLCEMVVDGLTQRLPSYYLAAAASVIRCVTPPATPMSKMIVPGFTRAVNSNDYFSSDQLDAAAGYGVWWWINDGGRVLVRHQLTTDPTSVKTRELSMTVALDVGAKIIRVMLMPLSGTVTINSETVQQLMVLVQGALDFIVQSKIWNGAHNPELTLGPFNPTTEDLAEGLGAAEEDEVALTVDVELPPPLNRIRVRLVVA
jgi:hypothetical protein